MEVMEMGFKRKVVSLHWILIPTEDYTACANLIEIHEG